MMRKAYEDNSEGYTEGLEDESSESKPPMFSWTLFWAYTGPGWLMSLAYLDPGNLEADLQNGAYTEYELLYVVLLSTVAGCLFQVLAARLGACTGHHLAQLCRREYPKPVSMALWVMTELAIIGSDVQEVLGSAIAFKLLFGLPLWVGCLLTALDTFTFLGLHRADQKHGASRYLEMLFLALIGVMCLCFFLDFTVSDPDGVEIARGILIPRMKEQDLTQAIGTLGAIIMPHNIFLHSALVHARQIDRSDHPKVREANKYFAIESAAALFISFLINAAVVCSFASSFYSAECADLSVSPMSDIAGMGIQTSCIPVQAALSSGSPIYDSKTGHLCTFDAQWQTPSNTSITSLDYISSISGCQPCYVNKTSHAPQEFHLTAPNAGYCQEIGLSDAGEAISASLGSAARVIWAVGLLASGQASTMTGTYAGQFVMEGFLNLRIDAWKRVALTRGMALIPALFVALLSQQQNSKSDHFNEFLNVLQSVQLPFALIPLLAFTSKKRLMGNAFANSAVTAVLMMVGTVFVCGVNYALVYRILQDSLPDDTSPLAWFALAAFASFYAGLLLYLILFYPWGESTEYGCSTSSCCESMPTCPGVSTCFGYDSEDDLKQDQKASLLENEE